MIRVRRGVYDPLDTLAGGPRAKRSCLGNLPYQEAEMSAPYIISQPLCIVLQTPLIVS